jgi:mannose-1-phosphate guanylyltransferase
MPKPYAVILAGGSGTRFWPASRPERPKQLLCIGPRSDRSLISETVRRIAPICPPDRIVIATNASLVEPTRRVLPDLPADAFLGEPIARNTAPCIGWATAVVRRKDPDAIVMVLPSDHYVGDEQAYLRTVEQAVESAASGVITTIGVNPTRPETGYGYIEVGEAISPDLRRALRFVEKPDRERAQEYLDSGRYVWNSGMFFFRASTMLKAIERYMPELASGLARIEAAHARGAEAERAETRAVFESAPSVSIDYGVMEKIDQLNVVCASFGWSDLGSWQTAWELAKKDEHGNAVPDDAVMIDARGNLVRLLGNAKPEKTVALVGVNDLCVIETEDALLVMPRERCQDVRLIVDELARRGSS